MRLTALLTATTLATAGLLATPAVAAAPDETVSFDVFSDIQGHLDDWDDVLTDAQNSNPDSIATVINGDIVDRGYASEYAGVREVMNRHDRDQPLLTTFGNHEAYAPAWCDEDRLCQTSWPNGWTQEDLQANFLEFSGTDQLYREQVVDGVAMLGLSPVTLAYWQDPNLDDHVDLGAEQLQWLRERLDVHAASGRPVFVFTHYPLADTVMPADDDGGRYHLQENEIRGILGDHPQAVLFTSHTHQDISTDRWATRVVVPGGHPDGFTAVDTGAVLNHQYLQVETGAAGAVLRARDASTGEVINELTVPSVLPEQDLVTVTMDAPVEAVAPGGIVEVSATVKQLGTAARESEVSLELPEGWGSVGPATQAVALEPGTPTTVTWRVLAPVAPGTAELSAVVEENTGTLDLEVAGAPTGSAYVSDLPFLAEQNQAGPIERDRTNGGPAEADRGPISLAGTEFEKGLGMLAPGSATVFLGGACSTFTAKVGLDDQHPQGSQARPLPAGNDGGDVVFVVSRDGHEVYRSGVVRGYAAVVNVEVDVTGAQELTLAVEDADGDSTWDFADWADAQVSCG